MTQLFKFRVRQNGLLVQCPRLLKHNETRMTTLHEKMKSQHDKALRKHCAFLGVPYLNEHRHGGVGQNNEKQLDPPREGDAHDL